MTLGMLISDIRNIATSGSNPIDFRIEDSQIAFWVNETRSNLISQAIKKRQDISTLWLQQINCLELVVGDVSDCCDTTTDCKVLKSVLSLPRTIETDGEDTIIRVETITGKIIPRANQFEAKYNKYNKYTADRALWYIKNDKLVIEGNNLLSKVNVVGIFEDPRELARYSDCTGATCWTSTSNYPCSNKMAQMITDIILKTRIYPFLQLPQDNSNDATNILDQPVNTKNLNK